jgi:hypothetical protein
MSKIGGKISVRERKQRKPHYLQSWPPGNPSGMLLRNNTTLSEVMTTYIPDGPHYGKKETKQCQISENIFHILHTKLGIKYLEKHMVLKYHGALHRYIQVEMEFLDISSLGAAYRYVVKIEQKLKQKTPQFGSGNPSQKNPRKGGPNPYNKGQRKDAQYQDNQSKPQAKKNTRKTKKDIRKWCDFYKSPWHNTADCCSKQSFMDEVKVSESYVGSDSDLEPKRGRRIINVKPSATVATTKLQHCEQDELEEGECLLHSQMWVKCTPLHFIIDSGSQKNLISVEVIKQLDLSTTPHPQPYTIGWLHQESDICVSHQCRLSYSIKPFKDEVLCDVSTLEVCDVILGQPYLWKRHVVYDSRPRSFIITLNRKLCRILLYSSDRSFQWAIIHLKWRSCAKVTTSGS